MLETASFCEVELAVDKGSGGVINRREAYFAPMQVSNPARSLKQLEDKMDDYTKGLLVAMFVTTILSIVLATFTLDKTLTEVRNACESTNATLGEICARLDSITITMPENAKIYYFGK